ncbi:MAG: hypothetical protein KAT58_03330, partial [candidate division Zixibacteria bacterium]|nr:hypothetical protein [candidate division Zixibacteria bacterium]
QTERVLMVLVNGPETGWPERDLTTKLERLFGGKNKFELVPAIEAEVLAATREGRFRKVQLIDHGLRINCRYIVSCDLIREELTLERHFRIPFLINQNRVAAILELDYHVVDCYCGRVVHSDRFKKHRFGSSSMQLLDNSGADPDLYLSYPDRKRLFDDLEDDAAREIFAELERIAKQR